MIYTLTHTVSYEDTIINEVRIRLFQPIQQFTYDPNICNVFRNGCLLLQGEDYYLVDKKLIFAYSILKEGDLLVISFILPDVVKMINII